MLLLDISSESDVVDFSRCWLLRPFSLFYPIREVKTWDRDLHLEARQRSKGLIVGWRNIELFAVSPARRVLVFAVAPAFWYALNRPPLVSCGYDAVSFVFLGLLARDDTSLTSRVRCLEILECTVLTIGAINLTVCFDVQRCTTVWFEDAVRE